MKIIKSLLAFFIGAWSVALFGHDIPVHQAITANAENSAYLHSPAYVDFLNTISSDRPRSGPIGATNSMVNGSGFEDNIDAKGDVGGKRSLNHFYDPLDTTYGKGLSDEPPDIRAVVGTNSFAWASISNCVGYNYLGELDFPFFGKNVNTTNIYSWPNARGYEWLGLTATDQLQRQTNLDNMFRAVGQVMHLLEDTSQPQHVRNEQHLDSLGKIAWESPIEDWGNDNVNKLNYGDGSMLDWRGDGFTKLEDFWDRHLYNGNAQVLDDAEDGGAQLGLAEWCNGNFLGQRHLFPEYFTPGDIEYYPFPSRDHSTDYSDVKSNPANHLSELTLENGKQGKGIYLAKTGDGIHYSHIARVNYLGAKFPNITNLVGTPYCTINDSNVLKDYHAAFIPKAVEYSAGLLDYFFRGNINVCIGPGSTADTLSLFVENKSGTNLYGGTLSLFSEDAYGTRTLILTNNLSDLLGGGASLDDGASVSTDFTSPSDPPSAFMVVYEGTIGTTNSTPLDPVDANIAIAAKRVVPIYPDSDGPAPDSLVYPDTNDLGEVTVDASTEEYTNRISFGNFDPGEYQVNYVEGAYGLGPGSSYWTVELCPSCSPDEAFGTFVWYIANEEGDVGNTGALPGANYWDGTYSLEDVYNITMSNNPEADFLQLSNGPISIKLGYGASNYSDGGSVTYQLQRVASFYPQPTNVRIRNYAAEVKPFLTICTNVTDATGESEWDGSFNFRELDGAFSIEWFPDDLFDYLVINGKLIDYAIVYYSSSRWIVEIYGATDGNDVLVWRGYKYTGTSSVGTYSRDASAPMCADELCCLYIESY